MTPAAAFITFDASTVDGRAAANKAAEGLANSYQAVARTSFQNIEPNISVREGFSRFDYEYFRPQEAIPKDKKKVPKDQLYF